MKLIGALIGLARATEGNEYLLTDDTAGLVLEALANQDPSRVPDLLSRIDMEKRGLVPMCFLCASPCGRTNDYDMAGLSRLPEQLRQKKLTLLQRLRSFACHAGEERPNKDFQGFLYRSLYAIGMDDWGEDELTQLIREADSISG